MNRISLPFTSKTPVEAGDEITRLSEKYSAAMKRALPANLLSLSSYGDPRFPRYGITLYWEPGQEPQAKWVRENVAKAISTQ